MSSRWDKVIRFLLTCTDVGGIDEEGAYISRLVDSINDRKTRAHLKLELDGHLILK